MLNESILMDWFFKHLVSLIDTREYFDIDYEMIWEIAKNELPKNQIDLLQLIEQEKKYYHFVFYTIQLQNPDKYQIEDLSGLTQLMVRNYLLSSDGFEGDFADSITLKPHSLSRFMLSWFTPVNTSRLALTAFWMPLSSKSRSL